MKVQEIAAQYLRLAEKRTRDNGEKFWVFNDEDENLSGLIQEAHGEMSPDDWRYRFVVEALQEIQDATDDDLDLDGFDDSHWFVENYEALEWFASHGWRPSYVDTVVSERGISVEGFSISDLIVDGYLAEKAEVFKSVLESLRDLADDQDEDDDDFEGDDV